MKSQAIFKPTTLLKIYTQPFSIEVDQRNLLPQNKVSFVRCPVHLTNCITAMRGTHAEAVKSGLRKFAVKFLFTFLYLSFVSLGGGYLMVEVLDAFDPVLMAVSGIITPLLAVVSLVLSIYYLVLGLFGKKEFVRVNI